MDYKELEKMDRCDVAYLYMISKMRLYRETIDKVTMLRKTNAKGRYIASIVVYLTDKTNNIHPLNFRLYDEEYLWFVCALQNDFPETPFFDLTEEKYKVVKTEGGEQNDVQTSEET